MFFHAKSVVKRMFCAWKTKILHKNSLRVWIFEWELWKKVRKLWLFCFEYVNIPLRKDRQCATGAAINTNILLTTDFAWKNIFFDIFLTLNAGCAAPACRPFPVPLAFLLSFARREKTVDGKALFCYTVKAINMEMYRSGRNENDSKSKWMLRQISPFRTWKRQNSMF